MKNKLILGVSGALTMTSFIAFSAACDNSNKDNKKGSVSVFDVDYDIDDPFVPIANKNNSAISGSYEQNTDQIKIGLTWSKSGNQYKILDSLVKYYNANVKTKTDKEVVIHSLGSSYGEGGTKLDQFLSGKDKTGSYNLIFNYSPNAGKLAERGMLLNFRDKDSNVDLDKSNFDKNFTEISNNVEHIQYSNGFWVVPGFKSTNTLSVNQPVLAYILKNMVAKGATIDPDFQELYNKILKDGSSDEAGVADIWGQPVENASEIVKGYVIKSSFLTQYQQMLKFAEIAQKLFTNSVKANTSLHVMGIDDAAGVFNQSVYSHNYVSNIKEDGLHKVAKVDGITQVSFDNISKNDATKRAAEEIFNSVKSALESSGLKLYGDGAYSSNDQVYHKMAFSIGSSAGYAHNYNNATKQINFKAKLSTGDSIELPLSKYNVYQLSNEVSAEHQSQGVKTYISSYKNLVFGFGADTSKGKGYDYKFATQEDNDLFTKNQQLINANRILLITEDNATKAKELEKLLKSFNTVEGNKVAYLGKVENVKTAGKFAFFVGFNGVNKSKDGNLTAEEISALNSLASDESVKIEETSGSKILSQTELLVMPTPLKWNDSSSRSIVYTQGPSIIGIRSTESDDKQTKKFVKWLLTSTDKIKLENNDFRGISAEFLAATHTPVEFIQYVANYFIPTNNFTKLADDTFGSNAALNVSLQMFKKASQNENVFIFEEPGATLSDKFRSQIVSQFKTVQNKIEQGKSNEINFVNDFVNQLNPRQ
ncbi:P68 family surface lipoprotein [Mycoplasmopsis anatis]|uniref:P68 family surface lipoprotein n=1 Tax=Mycoplasmopsis anatis TaxID=171279 RepID=UPI001C4FAD11|nr:P80 family lipoprotein [Mycoplasmopsis anatis]MBW0596601.1 hypothetical protein [Mycoplasmopsis anatis]